MKRAIAIHISEFLFEMDEDRAEGNVHDDRGDRKSWFHFSGAIRAPLGGSLWSSIRGRNRGEGTGVETLD